MNSILIPLSYLCMGLAYLCTGLAYVLQLIVYRVLPIILLIAFVLFLAFLFLKKKLSDKVKAGSRCISHFHPVS